MYKVFALFAIISINSFGYENVFRTLKKSTNNKFWAIDNYARNTPDEYSKNPSLLAKYLTTDLDSDWEKVRSIFIWVTENISYDVEGEFSGKENGLLAEGILESKKSICIGYSNLFHKLCKLSGLQSEIIYGIVKTFEDSDKPIDSKLTHSWNVIKIENQWCFFDPTWASGYIKENKYIKEYDDFWFNINPQILILSHFPYEKDWQLLDEPLSLNKFKKLPNLQEDFFKIGFTASEFYEELETNLNHKFPKVYKSNCSNVRKIVSPTGYILEDSTKYLFAFEIKDETKLILVNNKRAYKLFQNKNIHFISLEPENGKLQIVISPKSKTEEFFQVIIEYEVR